MLSFSLDLQKEVLILDQEFGPGLRQNRRVLFGPGLRQNPAVLVVLLQPAV